MKKTKLLIFLFFIIIFKTFAQEDTLTAYYEKIENSLKYQTGKINFVTGHANLIVPKGFKFLDAKQTQYVLSDLWGNPADKSYIGSLVPEGKGVTYTNSWMFIISYQDDGFVKDDDADDINYDDLLNDIQKDIIDGNPERIKQGFPSINLIGWASKPFYDKKLKVLHWAKEIKFGGDETNTLNYDLRVLGRKGMFTVSAIAGINELAEVKESIPGILKSIQYENSYKYSDFDESSDHIAEWTIGGLIAGKVLAKVGFFAIIAKFAKVIFLAIAGGFAALKKFVFGKKDQIVTKPEDEIVEEKDSNEEL